MELQLELQKKLQHYRLSKTEYDMICDQLGRAPQGIEWALFSALWSEHCSYKSSKVHLKKFYSTSSKVVQGFGENAGVIDLGEGERVAFKMESHNHPSFIEPYQGAATGVGGILRDIFTMGARPVALANYLCFGKPKAARMASLVDGVVHGIGGYGNCVGVPTITGQTEFHSSYDGNILVNALAVGYFGKDDKVFISKASGVKNWVVYVGAKTGRDGVHGASMASESFDEDSDAKKPTIQIGDPFFEKCLIESCLEVMREDLVVAIQDMGAAGLTSSSFEMASKGGVGLELRLDEVPIRDASITPEEILLSESQERMLLICEPAQFGRIQEIFARWNLDASHIGEVLTEKVIRLCWKNETLCEIDPDLLVENAPMYERPYNAWTSPRQLKDKEPLKRQVNEFTSSAALVTASAALEGQIGLEGKIEKALKLALTSEQGCDRSWIYRQYDQRVGAATAADCSEPVGIIRLPESHRPLGLVLGCRPHVMRMDVAIGGQDAIFYPSLELASKGLTPLAVTDCLNFGNPEKVEVMTEFVAAVESMSAACESLDTPVISGNVSFYNETLGKNVTSTPSTGVVGLGSSIAALPKSYFIKPDEKVFLVRLAQVESSVYWAETCGKNSSFFGEFNNQKMAEWILTVAQVVNRLKISSSRVVGKFGLGYALSRMCLNNAKSDSRSSNHTSGGMGFKLHKDLINLNEDLFIERFYEIILAGDLSYDELCAQFKSIDGVEILELGSTQKDNLSLTETLSLPIKQLQKWYRQGWEEQFETLA